MRRTYTPSQIHKNIYLYKHQTVNETKKEEAATQLKTEIGNKITRSANVDIVEQNANLKLAQILDNNSR